MQWRYWFLSTIGRLILTSVGLVVSLLPRSIEVFFGRLFGLFLYKSKIFKYRIVQTNLTYCFPGRADLVEKFYKHFGLTVCELLHLFSPIPGHYRRYLRRHVTLTGAEHIHQAQRLGLGILFVGTHLANWEFLTFAAELSGVSLVMVTKHLKPAWLHATIEKQRKSIGVDGAYEPKTMPTVLRALRANKAVGFVLDQYAGAPIGIPVAFFGTQAETLNAVGKIQDRTNAIVLPVQTVRHKDGSVEVICHPAVSMENFTDSAQLTQHLATLIEKWIRQYPEQWLWTHRRFKNSKAIEY